MQVKDRVLEVITQQLGLNENQVTPESNLMTDFGADSLDLIELCMALEEEFEIDIEDHRLTSFKTVQDIIVHIENN